MVPQFHGNVIYDRLIDNFTPNVVNLSLLTNTHFILRVTLRKRFAYFEQRVSFINKTDMYLDIF